MRCVFVEIGDRDVAAFSRENERDVLADAARGTGDDGRFALESHGSFPSIVQVVVDDGT